MSDILQLLIRVSHAFEIEEKREDLITDDEHLFLMNVSRDVKSEIEQRTNNSGEKK